MPVELKVHVGGSKAELEAIVDSLAEHCVGTSIEYNGIDITHFYRQLHMQMSEIERNHNDE